ncbi:MAG: insulinase family protein [Acidobacteria bacterium]|nr:insulinase family protein [Acidobacteriota bacterium]
MTMAIHRGLAPVRAVLGNGAVVIAKESPTTPAVTVHASFRAGTVFDPADQAGLSHFVSRTIDRGTETRPADRIAEALDGRGVSLSISVNRHALSLVCTCLVEDLVPILDLLADIVSRPTFPKDEVDTKRGEIVTLIRQDEDNPAALATEGLLTELYGAAHPYGRRPRGSVEGVETIGGAALQRFHAERFSPDSLSLVMVGDIEPARAIDAAGTAFGQWAVATPPAFELPEVAPASSRRVRVIPMMNKAQADIAYGFTSVRRADPGYDAYWLMNNILGQYAIGGRLGDSIRERQGMAYYVFSALDANVIPGPLTIRAGVSPANVDRAVASIDEELRKLAAEGPTDSEMTESKQYLIGSMPRTLETNLGIATLLQTEEFFGLGLDYDLRVPDLLRAVTREDVNAAARRTLVPAHATVVIAGPYAGEAR